MKYIRLFEKYNEVYVKKVERNIRILKSKKILNGADKFQLKFWQKILKQMNDEKPK